MRNLDKAVTLIKSYEGIVDGNPKTVNLDPYLCPAKYWTIGWGHVVLDHNGAQIKGAENKQHAIDIYPNGITMVEALVLLSDDVRRFSSGVEKLVKVPINDNQFGALVSFSFNVGMGSFGSSTLLKVLNTKAYNQVPTQLARWNKIGGDVCDGLTRRRNAEILLWETAI
ncbi:lysozyme [bacterium]|nr:lysozyme [bacterium]